MPTGASQSPSKKADAAKGDGPSPPSASKNVDATASDDVTIDDEDDDDLMFDEEEFESVNFALLHSREASVAKALIDTVGRSEASRERSISMI